MNSKAMVHPGHPTRVVFGAGAVHMVPEEVKRLGLERVWVISTPGRADLAQRINGGLGEIGAGIYPEAEQHVPLARAEHARQRARESEIDGVLAVGGGSTIGLAKAIALSDAVRILAVPTTYAGSELTPVWGLTDHSGKRTGRDRRVLPSTVIYDPDLTLALPIKVSGASGMNALAHAVEALYAPDGSPLVDLYAEESVRAFSCALPAIVARPHDRQAREQALYATWLAGSSLGLTSMGLHHRLCHLLGGTFGLPHAEVHAVMLAHVLGFYAPAVPKTMARLARALGRADVPRAVYDLALAVGAPTSLAELGLARDALGQVIDDVLHAPPKGPRPLARETVTGLVQAAWLGTPPQTD